MKSPLQFRRLARWGCATFASLAFVALTGRSCGADTTSRMEEIVQRQVAAKQFTGAVLVGKRGVALFDRAYGSANLEWDIANTPATHYRIG